MILPILLALAQSSPVPDEWCTQLFSAEAALDPPGGHPQPGQPPQTIRISIETDFEFWSIWGSTQLATDYVNGMVNAVNDVYCSQVGVELKLVYLGIHTTAADGWDPTDTLNERIDAFRLAWAPLGSNTDCAHFLSGANLGGGLSYVDVLCNKTFAFSVSSAFVGNIYWPNWNSQPHSGNWDFIVFAHELGHIFGARHTHDYCPPLDRCRPTCLGPTVCELGTLMSYCHLCGGSLGNINPVFHPTSAQIMRAKVAGSCLAGRECQ